MRTVISATLALLSLIAAPGCTAATEEDVEQEEQELRALTRIYDVQYAPNSQTSVAPPLLAPDGRVFAVVSPQYRAHVQEFATDGTPGWKSAETFQVYRLLPSAPIFDDEGNLYVREDTAERDELGSLRHSGTLRSFDRNGTLRWRTRLYDQQQPFETAGWGGSHEFLFETTSKNVYVQAGSHLVVVGKDGVIRWSRKGVVQGNALAVGPRGEVMLVGRTFAADQKCFREHLQADGTVLWSTRPQQSDACNTSIGILGDGRALSAGVAGGYRVDDWSARAPAPDQAPAATVPIDVHYLNGFHRLADGRLLAFRENADTTWLQDGAPLHSLSANGALDWSLPGVNAIATSGTTVAAIMAQGKEVCVLDKRGRRRACTAIPSAGKGLSLSLSPTELVVQYSLPSYERRLLKLKLQR
jgi:hypothetical protein